MRTAAAFFPLQPSSDPHAASVHQVTTLSTSLPESSAQLGMTHEQAFTALAELFDNSRANESAEGSITFVPGNTGPGISALGGRTIAELIEQQMQQMPLRSMREEEPPPSRAWHALAERMGCSPKLCRRALGDAFVTSSQRK